MYPVLKYISLTRNFLQLQSRNTTRVTSVVGKDQVFTYNVKVINSLKKSIYSIKHLVNRHQFSTLSDLVRCVKEGISGMKDDVLGYIEPGHGQKGKLRELTTDDDLKEMYVLYKRKQEILLWCYGDVGEQTGFNPPPQRKRKQASNTDAPPPGKRQAIAKSINEVEDIIKKLKEKHGDAYSVEKLNCWAHMLNVGKHSSYEEPPDFPFFKKCKKKVQINDKVAASPSGPTCNSPSKRVGLRTQCIDQLSKWHELLNAGAIDQTQYDELKETILGDIKKM